MQDPDDGWVLAAADPLALVTGQLDEVAVRDVWRLSGATELQEEVAWVLWAPDVDDLGLTHCRSILSGADIESRVHRRSPFSFGSASRSFQISPSRTCSHECAFGMTSDAS